MTSMKTAGLANIIASESQICTVGVNGQGLNYRGYSIKDLANNTIFEEVAYLLIHEKLPTKTELHNYQNKLIKLRSIPEALKVIITKLPKSAHPMDVLRTCVSALGCLELEDDISKEKNIADRVLAIMPGILLLWYQQHHNNRVIDGLSEETTIAAHFLHLLRGSSPSTEECDVMNKSLILYAEHEFNASTFSARVSASTLSDFYSSICSAIGTLRGPLHGGANEAAMILIQKFNDLKDVDSQLETMLKNKEKIMGFGHRVYTTSDPRSDIIKQCSQALSKTHADGQYYKISEIIEQSMWQRKQIFPNLDFYSATAYHFLNIPVSLYTPIFVCSRVTGWAAHIFEQRQNNALIRPSAKYTGPESQSFTNIDQRVNTHSD